MLGCIFICSKEAAKNLDLICADIIFQSGLGLSDVSGSYADGVFTCQFTRKKQLPDEKEIFDLNNAYHMLFAYGVAVDGENPPTPPFFKLNSSF